MTWGRRIYLYAFGFGLGLLICWVFFFRNGSRDLGGWLPENRVTMFVSGIKTIDMDSSLAKKMQDNNLTLDSLRKGVANGDVDFDKSNTHKEPCHEYLIKFPYKGKNLEAYFSVCARDSSAKLLFLEGF